MFQRFLYNFHALPASNRAMVYLMWIYGVGEIISGIFMNIYVFKINNSIIDAVLYNIVFYTACLIGFAVLGQIMGILGKNIKYMYYVGYILFIGAFIEVFLFQNSLFGVLLFGVLYGLGNGAFWNAVHTQELQNIADKNRDFYSSSISAGDNIVAIVVPILIALIFILSEKIAIDGYVVLFIILPMIYMISFLFVGRINSYIPKKITRSDVRNFFNLRKYGFGHSYFLSCGVRHGIGSAIIPMVSILLLKNESNIGIFQGILTTISVLFVVHLSHQRNPEKRFFYLLFPAFGLFLSYGYLGCYLDFMSFLLFSFLGLLIKPIFNVSSHVYDLSLMDSIKTEVSDFYPAMIFREYVLWIGRFLGLGLLYILSLSFHLGNQSLIAIGLFIIGSMYLIQTLGVFLWEKYEKVK